MRSLEPALDKAEVLIGTDAELQVPQMNELRSGEEMIMPEEPMPDYEEVEAPIIEDPMVP